MTSSNQSNWILGIEAVHGNPYDGATLIPALKRNYLKGKAGDKINALLTGCGFNLRKLLRFLSYTPLLTTLANT